MTSPPGLSLPDAPQGETGSTPRSAGEIYQSMLSYGVAVASITVAVAGARLLYIYLIAAPVSLLLCAIMFTARVGGVRPAVLAMVLSLLAFKYYVVTPTHSFAVNIQEAPRIIFFALSALFVVWLSATQRHAVQALKKING